MPERLTPLEATLLSLDTARTPAHVCTLTVFGPEPRLDHDTLLAHVGERIAYAPRYRQRVRSVPARLAGPVWVEDEGFDLTRHVRRVTLPGPGTVAQLDELVARLSATRLDRARPLWEMQLVEGLEGGRTALLSRSHASLVDGIDTVDLLSVLLDADADARPSHPPSWLPLPEPSGADLLVGAALEAAQDPRRALLNAQYTLTGALGAVLAVGLTVGELTGVGGAGPTPAEQRGSRSPSQSPLTGTPAGPRRCTTVAVPLADLRAVRAASGHTVHDVVLAVLAGGLRSWLLVRGEPVGPSLTVSALVPMSVVEGEGEVTSLGSSVAPTVVRLPVGEPDPLVRLRQLSTATEEHRHTGRAVDATTLTEIAGFAPATLHVLGVRAAAGVVRPRHDLVVTNAPGPRARSYAAGAPVESSSTVLPLGPGHVLAVGVTSYDGVVTFALTGDRDAVSDLDVLAQGLTDAVQELRDTLPPQPGARQRTRTAGTRASGRRR